MKVLDLFSGIGGFSLGLERAGMETIAFCEIEPFCQKVLKKHWPDVPIFNDIRTLTAHDLPTKPELICGGYPCQPFSVAGKQRGAEDNRHLWPEMYRLIKEIRPAWIIAENVFGHVAMGLDTVLSDLEGEGYTARTLIIPACALNAPHRRDRVWIIGYSHSNSQPVMPGLHETQIMQAMGDSQHNGLSTATITGKPTEAGQRITEGKNSTSEFKGASGRKHDETVDDTYKIRLQKTGSKHQTTGIEQSGSIPNPNNSGCRQGNEEMEGKPSKQSDSSSIQSKQTLADTDSQPGCQKLKPECQPDKQGSSTERTIEKRRTARNETESRMGGATDGIPRKLDENSLNAWMDGWEDNTPRVIEGCPNRNSRLKAIGNSVVPQIPEVLGRLILEWIAGNGF